MGEAKRKAELYKLLVAERKTWPLRFVKGLVCGLLIIPMLPFMFFYLGVKNNVWPWEIE